jgi:hypothetical protein
MSYVGFVSVVAIVALLVAALIFFVPTFSNNNDTPLVNRWVLSGRYEDPRGASIEFINGTHAIMGTRIYWSGFESVENVRQENVITIIGHGFEPVENVRHGDVITITGHGFEPVENVPLSAFSYLTYTLDGNQITFYTEVTEGFDKVPVLFGYATVSDNTQEIVFYGDVYIKN